MSDRQQRHLRARIFKQFPTRDVTCPSLPVAAEISATADRRILNVRARACKHGDTPSGKTVSLRHAFLPDSSVALPRIRQLVRGTAPTTTRSRTHVITESPCRPATHEFRILENGPSSYSRPALIVHNPVHTFR